MKRLSQGLWAAAGGSAFLVLGAAALLYGNDWWLSGLATVAFLAWLAGVLAACYAPPARRTILIGAVVAGFLYMLLALGPWFGTTVGPWLLTTRALVHIETKWLLRDAQPQVVYQLVPTYSGPGGYTGGGSGVVTWPMTVTGGGVWTSYPAMNSYVPIAGGPTTFVAIGHWLCGVMAAVVGALAVAWISRRRPSRSASGENPFAETPQ
jgi:hypothetical protein